MRVCSLGYNTELLCLLYATLIQLCVTASNHRLLIYASDEIQTSVMSIVVAGRWRHLTASSDFDKPGCFHFLQTDRRRVHCRKCRSAYAGNPLLQSAIAHYVPLNHAQWSQLSRRSANPTLTNISSDNLILVESRIVAVIPTAWLRDIVSGLPRTVPARRRTCP